MNTEVVILEVREKGTINGKKVKCVKSTGQGCKQCCFQFECNKKNRPVCYAHERPDRTSVFFTEA